MRNIDAKNRNISKDFESLYTKSSINFYARILAFYLNELT